MADDAAKLTVDQLKKLAQDDKKKAQRAKASLAQALKSAEELAKAGAVVADISKKNPEL
jgi:hypothetical protein